MKTLLDIIEEGLRISERCKVPGYTGFYYEGQEYDNWLQYSKRFLLSNYPNDPQTSEFVEIANAASGNGNQYFNKLIGILKAFDEIPLNKYYDR